MGYGFTPDMHPELLDVVLDKRFVDDWLKELQCVQKRYRNYGDANAAKAYQDIAEISNSIRAASDAGNAVSGTHLLRVIQEVTGVDLTTTSYESVQEEAEGRAACRNGDLTRLEQQQIAQEKAAVRLAEGLLATLSPYIAVQEHREALYLELIRGKYKETVMDMAVKEKTSGELTPSQRDGIILQMAKHMLFLQAEQHERANRHSPIADIEREVLHGNQSHSLGLLEQFRDAMAYLLGYDRNNPADIKKWQQVEARTAQLASRQTGIPLPQVRQL